jgi:hypothetical protein
LLALTGNGATGHVIAGGGMTMVVDGKPGLLHPAVSAAEHASAMPTR